MGLLVTRLCAVVFVSGFCSLVYQVAWLRLLRLVFGASTSATAVVLAIFMGGLGFGGLWLGRRVERSDRPLAFYARLELGIAVTAAASPLLAALVKAVYVGLGGSASLGLSGATVLRLGLAVLVLLVPTFLMGGTLPAAARTIERREDHGRRRVAVLYGFNTAGALLGAFATNFYLLERFGIRQSLWLAAVLNLLLALAAFAMARRLAAQETAEEEGPDEPIHVGKLRDDVPRRLVLTAAFVVGFLFFLMEIVWYRMLAPLLGGSSYTFGLILAVALLGIAAGGLAYSLGSQGRRPATTALAWTCLLEALALAVPFALGDDLAYFAAVVRPLGTLGFSGLVLAWTLVTVVVVLPAALVAGYQFPLLVALLGSGRRRVAEEVGLAYAWNTWGAILGSLAGGFGLLPLVSAPWLWRLSAYALLLLGLALLADGADVRRPWRLLPPVAVAILAALCCLAPGPTAFWRQTSIGAGRLTADFQDVNRLRDTQNLYRRSVLREADGVESGIALLALEDLVLMVNGKSDGSAVRDAPTTVMSGLVGAALHPEPKKVLVIGLGTGATAGWLARVGSVERIDVVELEPTVSSFAGDFAAVHFGVLDNPKVRLIHGDGREWVLTSDERYDLIFSEPSNPYRAGVADLFSRDFYQAVSHRLAPGGIFLQWLQGYEVDAGLVALVYSTLGESFAHLESWRVHRADLLLLAAQETVVHDYDRLRLVVEQEPFDDALAKVWGVRGVEGLYSGYLGGDALSRRVAAAAGGRVSSDDHPSIEFAFARNVGRTGLFDVNELYRLARTLDGERPASTRGAPVDWQRVEEARGVRALGGTFFDTGLPPGEVDRGFRARQEARKAYARGDLEEAERAWSWQSEPPTHPLDEILLAEVFVGRFDERAEGALEALRASSPVEAAFLRSHHLWLGGDAAGAADALVEAFAGMRREPWAYPPVVTRGFERTVAVAAADPRAAETLFAALREPLAAMRHELLRQKTLFRLLEHVGFARHCGEVMAPAEPYPTWQADYLRVRLQCYEALGHPHAAQARADLESFVRAAPPTWSPFR